MSDVFPNIKTVSLVPPDQYRNGAPEEGCFDSVIAAFQEIHDKLERGERVYVGYISGERKGSIAYIAEDYDLKYVPAKTRWTNRRSWEKDKSWVIDFGFHCVVRWDKRRNKVQCYVAYDVVYLPDYEGPTVWEKFDKKGAEKAATENVVIKDREGNQLAVGDRVLYINARYGSAGTLDRGCVNDIKVKVSLGYQDKKRQEVNVIIDNDNGEQSKIKHPEQSVLKYT